MENAAEIADKRFGQNFLKESYYIGQIIQAIPNNGLPIVEIGPGLGDLTKELVRVGNVTAYEVDKRLCEYLKEAFSKEILSGKLTLVCDDVMDAWRGGDLGIGEYNLVANLPYYIATNLVVKGLKDEKCRSILTMVQREVARKFTATSGEKEFSSLSVLARSCGDANLLFEVPPEAFTPPPKVTSAVMLLKKSSSLRDGKFEAFLKVAFKQPRKKLLKNLSSLYDSERLKKLFSDMKLDSDLRPHQAETSVYHRLYNELTKDDTDGEQQKSG